MNRQAVLKEINDLKAVYHKKIAKGESMVERMETLAVYMIDTHGEIQALIKKMHESTDGVVIESILLNIQLLSIDADGYILESQQLKDKCLIVDKELALLDQEINTRLVFIGLNTIIGDRK